MGVGEMKMIMKCLIIAAFCLAFALAGFDACRNTYTTANCGGAVKTGDQFTNGNYVCFKTNTGAYMMISSANNTCDANTRYTLKEYTDATCKTVKLAYATNTAMTTCVLGQMKITCGACTKKTITCTTNKAGTSTTHGSGTCAASGSSTLLPSLSFMAIVTAFM